MLQVKTAAKMGVQYVTPRKALSIIDTRSPLGLFYTREGNKYVGIDNSKGMAWTEDLESFRQCMEWCKG